MKKVSIIIPLYNQYKYLREAVDSVCKSSYPNMEIIIVNDGSTDISNEELKNEFCGIAKIITQSNQGVCSARNNGIDNATGEYILTLDADDKIDPTFIAKASSILANDNNIGIVYSKAEYFGDNFGEWYFPQYDNKKFLIDNCIQSCALFRKEDWKASGGYKYAMESGGEDWEFWLSIIELGKIPYRIEEPLFYYRKHKSSKTSCNYEAQYLKILSNIILLHTNLYVQDLNYIVPELFFRIFKQYSFKKQFSYILKFTKRALMFPLSRIINRRKMLNLLHSLFCFKINNIKNIK